MQIALKSIITTLVAVFVSLLWARPASAAWGICLESAASPGGYASYGSNGACDVGGGFYYENEGGGTASVITDPSEMGPDLTGGSITLTSNNNPSTGGFAGTNLAQGTIAASASAGPRAFSDSFLFDGLHFTITDGANDASIIVRFHLEGSTSAEDGYDCLNSFELYLGGFLSYDSYVIPPDPPIFGDQRSGWASSSVTNEWGGGFDFTGVVNVIDGQNTGASVWLQSDCVMGSGNFSGTLSWTLPDNVTVTSDSGLFLSQP
jgi:hypothetical protein